MTKTIAQLNKEIAEQRKRISREQILSKKIAEKQKLSQQLFELKNRKFIGFKAKAKRLSRKFGKRILKAGKTIAPAVQKQARLIRDQQLRDDAIEKARRKRAKKGKTKTRITEKFVPIKGKKGRFKKIKVKTITKIPKKKTTKKVNNIELFQPLDF